MKIFQYLSSSDVKISNNPDLIKYDVAQMTPGFNEDTFKETKLNQNGIVETNSLFNYKTVHPQPKYAELHKYNGLLSSDSSSDEEYDLPKTSSDKQKRIFRNCEYVVTTPIEAGEIENNNFDNNSIEMSDTNLKVSSDCCMSSVITTMCSIM